MTAANRAGPFLGLTLLAGLATVGIALNATPATLSWVFGGLLGIVFQRGRFCFYCIFADLIEKRYVSGALAVVAALAVGLIGYELILGVWLPNPAGGRLPPGAFITPVSWVLAVSGLTFGVGMALSGACLSGHLYRLGEGYGRAVPALLGALVGFGIGFMTWSPLYLGAVSRAPVVWLPAHFGHGGALALQLGILAVLAIVLVAVGRDPAPREAGPGPTAGLTGLHKAVLGRRWPPLITGTLVGVIGTAAYFRVEPLGVTAQLSTVSRTLMDSWGLLGGRLPGLDTLAGCIAIVSTVILNNGWLVMALVLGSAAAAQLSGRFRLELPTLRNGASAALGGVLMGWGSMTALGCTVGALLSGIMAGGLSGWVFLVTCLAGVWLGIRLRRGRL